MIKQDYGCWYKSFLHYSNFQANKLSLSLFQQQTIFRGDYLCGSLFSTVDFSCQLLLNKQFYFKNIQAIIYLQNNTTYDQWETKSRGKPILSPRYTPSRFYPLMLILYHETKKNTMLLLLICLYTTNDH